MCCHSRLVKVCRVCVRGRNHKQVNSAIRTTWLGIQIERIPWCVTVAPLSMQGNMPHHHAWSPCAVHTRIIRRSWGVRIAESSCRSCKNCCINAHANGGSSVSTSTLWTSNSDVAMARRSPPGAACTSLSTPRTSRCRVVVILATLLSVKSDEGGQVIFGPYGTDCRISISKRACKSCQWAARKNFATAF